jgi:hypothetical protein
MSGNKYIQDSQKDHKLGGKEIKKYLRIMKINNWQNSSMIGFNGRQ